AAQPPRGGFRAPHGVRRGRVPAGALALERLDAAPLREQAPAEDERGHAVREGGGEDDGRGPHGVAALARGRDKRAGRDAERRGSPPGPERSRRLRKVRFAVYENLLVERHGAVAILTVNRPKALNALTQ